MACVAALRRCVRGPRPLRRFQKRLSRFLGDLGSRSASVSRIVWADGLPRKPSPTTQPTHRGARSAPRGRLRAHPPVAGTRPRRQAQVRQAQLPLRPGRAPRLHRALRPQRREAEKPRPQGQGPRALRAPDRGLPQGACEPGPPREGHSARSSRSSTPSRRLGARRRSAATRRGCPRAGQKRSRRRCSPEKEMPDLNAFEEDREAVLADLRRGEFDYVEVASRVTEARFFRYLLDQGDLKQLAGTYPTPRKKEEVPLWLYLASQLTLRLHGQHAYQALPYILHCGGLRDALGPGQVEVTARKAEGRSAVFAARATTTRTTTSAPPPATRTSCASSPRTRTPRGLVAWYDHYVAALPSGTWAPSTRRASSSSTAPTSSCRTTRTTRGLRSFASTRKTIR